MGPLELLPLSVVVTVWTAVAALAVTMTGHVIATSCASRIADADAAATTKLAMPPKQGWAVKRGHE